MISPKLMIMTTTKEIETRETSLVKRLMKRLVRRFPVPLLDSLLELESLLVGEMTSHRVMEKKKKES